MFDCELRHKDDGANRRNGDVSHPVDDEKLQEETQLIAAETPIFIIFPEKAVLVFSDSVPQIYSIVIMQYCHLAWYIIRP